MTRHPERTRLLIKLPKLAGEAGFEPTLPGPEPGVLPLDYSPAALSKAAKFGQKIQSPPSYR